ncbi:MAG: CHAP domain-containing protein [Elusimicrobia bacterium]|nr:CHAP domain-containing protein [Elusimicrobiota bacterium]
MELIAIAVWLLALTPACAGGLLEGRFAEVASGAGMAAAPAPLAVPAVPASVEVAGLRRSLPPKKLDGDAVEPPQDGRDSETREGTCTPTVLSEITFDTGVVPGPRSTIPGWEDHVEQCGEFVYRYFRAQGHGYPDYPTRGQPAEYILQGNYRDQFPAFTNPSFTAPRAGDILAAKGPAADEYHTALIWKVDTQAVWVYQANVPWGNRSPDWRNHLARLPMILRPDGSYFMPALPTSHLGYNHDFDVVGWIHPTGSASLAGAPQQ